MKFWPEFYIEDKLKISAKRAPSPPINPPLIDDTFAIFICNCSIMGRRSFAAELTQGVSKIIIVRTNPFPFSVCSSINIYQGAFKVGGKSLHSAGLYELGHSCWPMCRSSIYIYRVGDGGPWEVKPLPPFETLNFEENAYCGTISTRMHSLICLIKLFL